MNPPDKSATPDFESRQEFERGVSLAHEGEYAQAFAIFHQVLDLSDGDRHEGLIAELYAHIGDTYRIWGDLHRARQSFEMIDESVIDAAPDIRAGVLHQYANLLVEESNPIAALEALSEAYRDAQKSSRLALAARIKHDIGIVLETRDQPNHAISHHEEALDVGGDALDNSLRAQINCQIAACYLAMKLPKKAYAMLNRVLMSLGKLNRSLVKATVLWRLGECAVELGRDEESIEHLREAARIALQIAQQAGTAKLRATARNRCRPMVGLLLGQLWRYEHFGEAVQWSERMRSNELLFGSVGRNGTGSLARPANAQQDNVSESFTIENSNEVIRSLQRACGKERDIIALQLPTSYKSIVGLMFDEGVRPTTAELAQFDLELDGFAHDLLGAIRDRDEPDIAELLEVATAIVTAMVGMDINKLSADSERTLIWLGQGVLDDFPLEAVGKGSGKLGLRMPIERYLSAQHLLNSNERSVSQLSKTALVVVDPTRDVVVELSEYGLHAFDGTLHGAATEGSRIAEQLRARGWQVELLSGAQARANRFWEACDGREYSLIHFAGHALFNPTDPGKSALLFRDDSKPAAAALVTAEQIANRLDMKSGPLVVLSGCNTAGISSKTTSIPDGLVRAWFASGAQAVVATGWPIRDDVARTFMDAFYESLHLGATVRVASLDARRKTATKSESSGDPALANEDDRGHNNEDVSVVDWASFRVFGQGRMRLS